MSLVLQHLGRCAALTCLLRVLQECKATLDTVTKLLQDSHSAVVADSVRAALELGVQAGWLVPEDEGAYHVKDPVQTPERAAQTETA
jgi:hypothetical protein